MADMPDEAQQEEGEMYQRPGTNQEDQDQE